MSRVYLVGKSFAEGAFTNILGAVTTTTTILLDFLMELCSVMV